ncbi:MAG: hypothetical protein A2428_02365 [Bdellovibrionales bacterium RIFOXYC1_FULL_54_43]|nr:MAG: hypothetical protein A2428_02365 [Bdellovibrionales bacterium RIFOXYC1_FULL_54_43]
MELRFRDPVACKSALSCDCHEFASSENPKLLGNNRLMGREAYRESVYMGFPFGQTGQNSDAQGVSYGPEYLGDVCAFFAFLRKLTRL